MTSRLKNIEEANEISAVRLVTKRQVAKAGDLFRLSPLKNVYFWGRLIKKANFFGLDASFNLVYIYNVISNDEPQPEELSPYNLIIGPTVVNNLGWSRGYWQIVSNKSLTAKDVLDRHYFIRYHGTGSRNDYDIVNEEGDKVRFSNIETTKLAQSGFSNFNHVDWQLKEILQKRGMSS